MWHFCSKSSTIKMEKMQKAALRVVFNDYTADYIYSQLLSMSKRSPLLIVRLRALLIEVFKCVRELDPIFMNILFTLSNKPYDTRSGSLITQSQVKTIKHGISILASMFVWRFACVFVCLCVCLSVTSSIQVTVFDISLPNLIHVCI